MDFRIVVIPHKGVGGSHSQSLIHHLLLAMIFTEASVAKCNEAAKDNGVCVHVCVCMCARVCMCVCWSCVFNTRNSGSHLEGFALWERILPSHSRETYVERAIRLHCGRQALSLRQVIPVVNPRNVTIPDCQALTLKPRGSADTKIHTTISCGTWDGRIITRRVLKLKTNRWRKMCTANSKRLLLLWPAVISELTGLTHHFLSSPRWGRVKALPQFLF